jgi:DNA polymerase III epsilon subunit-like protein
MSSSNSVVVDIESSRSGLIYDLGLLILNKDGFPVKQFCFLVKENLSLISKTKYAKYLELVEMGEAKILPLQDIVYALTDIVKTYKIKTFVAYNIGFDFTRIAKTLQQYKNPFENLKKICLWKVMKNYLMSNSRYFDFCKYNNFLTEKGKAKSTLETVIRYLTNDVEFNQSHCSLSDLCISALLIRYLSVQKISLTKLYKASTTESTISKTQLNSILL